MENIAFTMVLHNHLDGEDTIFSTMSVPLVNNPLERWLGVTRRGSHQAEDDESIWAYEPVSHLWRDIEPDDYSSFDGSSGEVIKYQENLDDKEQ